MRIAGKSSIFIVSLLFSLIQFSCKESPVETVEQLDDEGRTERFQRDKKNFAKEGLYQKFSTDGKLLIEAQYHHDTLNGERKYFYESGAVETVEHFKNGQYHGKYSKYNEDGSLSLEQDFVNGAMQGFSIAYYPNGNIQERVTIVDSEENGPFQEYYENGVLKTEGFYGPSELESALEQGELKEYNEQGELIRMADCQDGRCETRWKKE